MPAACLCRFLFGEFSLSLKGGELRPKKLTAFAVVRCCDESRGDERPSAHTHDDVVGLQ